MEQIGIQTFKCPDGSLTLDPSKCPIISTGLSGGGTRTRFLGAKGRATAAAQALALEETPEPVPFDFKGALLVGAAVFVSALLLFLILGRRKRRVRSAR